MKLVVLGAAALAVATLVAAPVAAQVVVKERTEVGDEVRHDNGLHRGWYKHRAECRVVKVKTTLPSGKVIIKTRRSC